ncbi:hypothetical protein EVAR_37420_1 [Eumeta japonica]|uniref:Uncharacterized protein n=1 Tax=Eumeta variegata TaxID=151549 RepID=A0A4C1WE45_EUMVA|nr:hypothetical protein EVAR_37420_1 [Eumeta japonica]
MKNSPTHKYENFSSDHQSKDTDKYSLDSQDTASVSGRKIDASQAERLERLSIACSALSLARSAQAERDNESCFFVRAAGFH